MAQLGFDPNLSSHFHVFEFDPNFIGMEVYSSESARWVHKEKGYNEHITLTYPNKLAIFLNGYLHFPAFGWLIYVETFLVPAGSGSNAGGITTKDKLGNNILVEDWLKAHGPNDRMLAQGIKGDPTYLVVESDKTLAVCVHFGCVVPWNDAENKFLCPCHGSQYNNQGKVVRGPAPLWLALVHADVDDGRVIFVPWVETDFRTGENPRWK
ncbi:cytochrome b6-f complex iron-sulfur subunit, chloroplastic-like [Aegilops tauschii subsp. strangulata]|nr:cytochrome b6-f complex iron-sulfur subunit, chloroplastic-like [Aegilops tauschii subsp. strangulata]